MEILIVEDEALAVQKLTALLRSMPQPLSIVGVTDGIGSTVEWLNRYAAPSLIFMDIELSDGQCFDIFHLTDVRSPVIFTTSYDEEAIRPFQVHRLDYLLKPIRKVDLEQALEKFYRLAAQPVSPVPVELLVDDLNKQIGLPRLKNQFLARHNQQLIVVEAANIAYFLVKDGVTYVFTHNKMDYSLEYSLDGLTTVLEPRTFFRISPSMIIHRKAILQTHTYLSGKLKLEVKPAPEFPVFVSPDRMKEFREWIAEWSTR